MTSDKPSSNRRYRNNGKWCVALSIILAATVFVFGAIAVVFSLSFNVDIKSPKNLRQQEIVFRNRGNRTQSSQLGDVTIAPDGTFPWQVFDGRWKVIGEENMDGYLTEVGIPWILRRLINGVYFEVMFKVVGNSINIQSTNSVTGSGFLNEYIVNGPPTLVKSRQHKSTAKTTWEDGKLIVALSQSEDGDIKPQIVTRQVTSKDEMTMVLEIADIVAKQFLVRIP